MYFEFVDEAKNSAKFWKITNVKSKNPKRVVVNYGKIGSDGITKEFIYHNNNWGDNYIKKQVESKIKKGYVKKTQPKSKKTQPKSKKNAKPKSKKTQKKKHVK